jgi:hypothetical protein
MEPLAIIDPSRLQMLPADKIAIHELAFWLHDKMTELLVETESSSRKKVWNTAFTAIDRELGQRGIENTQEFLAQSGGIISTPLKLEVAMAILSDSLHYIYEALTSFEKRKFNVGFSLLRKPFSENLMLLSWMLADDDEFIKHFGNGDLQKRQVISIDILQKKKIFSKSMKLLPLEEFFSSETLYDIIYNKDVPNGLQVRMQRAMHLITTNHPALSTPSLGLNSIFINPLDDKNYSFYESFTMVLFYMLSLTLALFHRYLELDERSHSEVLVRAVGLYANVAGEGRLDAISRHLNHSMKDFMKCEWCDGKSKIYKRFAPSFYLRDLAYCAKCRRFSHTPLTFLIRGGHLKLIPSDKISKSTSSYSELFSEKKKEKFGDSALISPQPHLPEYR